MKTFALNKRILLLYVTFLISCFLGFGQEIVSFSSLANNACSGVIANDLNLTATGICRGPGISINAGGTYNSNSWTTSVAIDADDYLEWTVTPNAGYQLNLTTMDIRYDRSGQGPYKMEIQVDAGSGYVTVYTDAAVSASSEEINGIDLTSFANVSGTITFRLYAYSAGSAAGNFDIEEHSLYLLNKGIVINGTVTPTCSSTVTWDGSAWLGGTPDITTEVIIDGAFNTSGVFPQASFDACNLVITNNGSLLVANGDYISVENDIDINGSMIVDYEGSVVQINDFGVVTGNAIVRKQTAPMFKYFEYTYWSSPVSGETIGDGLSDSDATRRFNFDAGNFKDSFTENLNDNVLVAGYDDIDDDGDDWQYVAATTIMQPGVGYASHHEESIFFLPPPETLPYQFIYTFEGPFNNGVISVPVLRNVPAPPETEEFGDFNWNLIGNPYPSAIDIDLFFTENNYDASTNPNGTLTGAVYLWSQNELPSGTNNGNENQNFVSSDYAIINRIGEVPPADNEIPGGDNLTPARFIPSGQGFFVAYSDVRPSSTGIVTFKNSMRVINNNDQFFRVTEQEDNTIALKLTTEDGIFNQMLVGYAQGATNLKDEMYYDAPRNLASGASAIIYSIIEDSPRKYAIQGRDINSLNSNDVIPIGVKSTIDSDLEFTISIAQTEGEFMTNNTIFLRDNLLNINHNLSQSGYTFNMDAGEYNSRFEIFYSETLSTNDFTLETDELIVSDKFEDTIEISTKNQSEISKIKIFDILGRDLIDVNLSNKTNVSINTSTLSNSLYIINAYLTDGKKLSKKFLNE